MKHVEPLDPESPAGIATAARLSAVLAPILVAIRQRRALAEQRQTERPAAKAA